jgi:HEAT repeats
VRRSEVCPLNGYGSGQSSDARKRHLTLSGPVTNHGGPKFFKVNMTNCYILTFSLLLALVSAISAAELPSVREPVIGNKGLSVWLDEYLRSAPGPEYLGDPQMGARAQEAVRKIGTNALPWLLQELSAREATRADELPTNYYSGEAIKRRSLAASAFGILGNSAKAATPTLVRLLDDRQTSYDAAASLAGIGVESIPVLTQALTNKHAYARGSAARVLAFYGAKAQSAVPALTQCMSDQDDSVRKWSAFALKKINPKPAAKAGVE